MQPEGGAPGTQPAGQPPNSQMPGGQAYQYSYPNYYGGQGQPPSGMPNQNYGGYPAYGGYGGQPQGPENWKWVHIVALFFLHYFHLFQFLIQLFCEVYLLLVSNNLLYYVTLEWNHNIIWLLCVRAFFCIFPRNLCLLGRKICRSLELPNLLPT